MKKTKAIKPINTLSLVDKVEISLREYFSENDLKPGDPIPKEIDLAQSLGVSRTVVREAILRLRTLGLVESKKHRGMVLTEPDVLNGFQKVLDPKLLGAGTLRDIFELRLILEMGMAEMLFARKTQADLDELEKIVEKGKKEGHDSTTFSLDQEIEFHGKLYQISGNETLHRFQSMLLQVFQFIHGNEIFYKHYNYPKGHVTHQKLFEILKTGTPQKFREAMLGHLRPHFESIFGEGLFDGPLKKEE